MQLRKRLTSHKISSDMGELQVVLSEPETALGAQLSNWQLVRSDPNGIYLVATQINLMGANEDDKTVEAQVLSHIFIPHSLAPDLLESLREHIGRFVKLEDLAGDQDATVTAE
jgi:hypothetical protein